MLNFLLKKKKIAEDYKNLLLGLEKKILDNNLMIALETDLNPNEPKDLFGLVEYLISEHASYITGQDFVVDGGWLAKGL